MITIKIPFQRPDLKPQNYQEVFIQEAKAIFAKLGDVSVSFETHQKLFDDDICIIELPTDNYRVITRLLVEANNDTSEKISGYLSDTNKDDVMFANYLWEIEKDIAYEFLSEVLAGATFKEICDGDIVLTTLNHGEFTISTGYDPYLSLYIEGKRGYKLE